MIRRLVIGATSLACLTATALPAAAITNGRPDGNGHPSVGGLVAEQAYSDGTWTYCSGTLIAPSVFLTAAHCGEGEGEQVRITFDTAYQDGDPVYAGTFHADPQYTHQQNDPHDIAVVTLEQPVTGITPAQLPKAESLSRLKQGQEFTSVGYGAYEVTSGPGGHGYLYNDVRMVTKGSLDAVNKAWLRLSMNPATGDGGTCYGDSGGPHFLGDTDLVAATTITGDAICRATNVDYRLDTASARAFLSDYVTLP
jgi:V8-like Glu-specific endopeptidase